MDQPFAVDGGMLGSCAQTLRPPDIGPTRIRSRGRIRPFCSRAASLRHCRCWRLRAVEVAAYYVVAAWVMHRDITPANIVVSGDGSPCRWISRWRL